MKMLGKIMIASIVLMVIPVHSCYQELKKLSRQVDRGRCDVKKAQQKAMFALSTCEKIERDAINCVLLILSHGNNFPQLTLHLREISNANEFFYTIPGFREKFAAYLSMLDQEKLANQFWRELSMALQIYDRRNETIIEGSDRNGEIIEGFDQVQGDGQFDSFFSLITTKRWIYWQHDQLFPSARRDQSRRVADFKALFLRQKNSVARFNVGRVEPVVYTIQFACSAGKSWRNWFDQQGIVVQMPQSTFY